MGRTEQFTEVQFDTPQIEGQIITTLITGHTAKSLVGPKRFFIQAFAIGLPDPSLL